MPPLTGSPAVTRNAAAGTIAVSEKALELIFWQPVQWQADVMKGGALSLDAGVPAAAGTRNDSSSAIMVANSVRRRGTRRS